MDESTWKGEMLMTPDQVAEWLVLERRTLDKWRHEGGGPKFIKISERCIRYRRSDLLVWLEEKVQRSTSDAGAEDPAEGAGRGWA